MTRLTKRKPGRPKSTKNVMNRRHTIILNNLAQIIFNKVSERKKGTEWIHQYLNQKLYEDYYEDFEETILREIAEEKEKESQKAAENALEARRALKMYLANKDFNAIHEQLKAEIIKPEEPEKMEE